MSNQEGLTEVVTFRRPDTCPVCGANRGLEMYDVYGKSINYGLLVSLKRTGDERYKDYLDEKRPIYALQCKRCGEQPVIYWDEGFPVPLTYMRHLNTFLKMYGY